MKLESWKCAERGAYQDWKVTYSSSGSYCGIVQNVDVGKIRQGKRREAPGGGLVLVLSFKGRSC